SPAGRGRVAAEGRERAPPLSATGEARRSVWPNVRHVAGRVAQYALAVAFIVYAAKSLWQQWRDASVAQLNVAVRPAWLLLSSLLVLATYLLLVEIWRRVLRRFDAHVPFGSAARVWFVSNLGKY